MRPANILVLALGLLLAGSGSSQRNKTAGPAAPASSPAAPLAAQDVEPFADPGGQDDTPLSVLAKEARLHAEDRQKHLVADTARLVELSTQLQADVNRSNKNVLSLENIRRTEEIEKLARKVRDRLRS